MSHLTLADLRAMEREFFDPGGGGGGAWLRPAEHPGASCNGAVAAGVSSHAGWKPDENSPAGIHQIYGGLTPRKDLAEWEVKT